MYWLFGSKSTENELLLYNAILKSICTDGIQLCSTASNSSIEILQRFENKILRSFLSLMRFGMLAATSDTLHQDLNMPHVHDSRLFCVTDLDSYPWTMVCFLKDFATAIFGLEICRIGYQKRKEHGFGIDQIWPYCGHAHYLFGPYMDWLQHEPGAIVRTCIVEQSVIVSMNLLVWSDPTSLCPGHFLWVQSYFRHVG